MRPEACPGFLLLIGVCFGWQSSPAANAQWLELKQLGETHDAQLQFKTAVDEYERALSLIPQQIEDSKIELEAEIASDYLRLDQASKAKPHVDHAIAIIERMRAQHREPMPEAIVALSSTVAEAKTDAHRDPVVRLAMAVELAERVMPDTGGLRGVELDYAQALVDDNRLDETQKQLTHILKFYCQSEQQKYQVELFLAATEERQGRPQHMQELFPKIGKFTSPHRRLQMIANAQFWAGEFDKANANAGQALQLLAKTNGKFYLDEQGLYGMKAKVQEQKKDYKEAEKWARRRLALLEEFDPKSESYQHAAHDLVNILNQQKRFKEAEQIKLAQPLSFDLFVTDADKKALQQASQAHRSHASSR